MEMTKKEGTENGSWPVKKIELPIKKVISYEQFKSTISDDNRKEIQEKHNSDCITDEELFVNEYKHNDEEFFVFCSCKCCIEYREVILQLMNDHLKTRSMWRILQGTIRKFYQPIIESAPPNVSQVYKDLVEDDKFSWLVNGTVNKTKLQHIDFISNLSLTDNMIFVLFSTLLIVDDPHQLFELMSYQVECFARAYAEGLLDKFLYAPEGQLPAEEIITYVLKGYDEMCKTARSMAGFLFAFESSHLEQFTLTWTLLNKRMYQKWVHSVFTAKMPECLIKLKDEVSPERCTMLVRKYIKFDDDMMFVLKKWREVWASLDKYHMSPKEQERRKRIQGIHDIFEAIRQDVCVPFNQFVDIPDWAKHSDRQLVWQNMVAYVKKRWPTVDEARLNANICSDLCKKCKSSLEFHRMICKCVTCLIAGGPSLPPQTLFDAEKQGICLKCMFLERVDKEGPNFVSKMLGKYTNDPKLSKLNDLDVNNVTFEDVASILGIGEKIIEKKGKYHLSWAVFKHLKDRRAYSHKTVDDKFFCSNCKNTSCMLAKKIINNEIAYGVAQHLVKHYQPFTMTDDEIAEMLPNILLYNIKYISMNLLYDPPNDDIVVKTFCIFITSAFASFIVDAEGDTNPIQFEHFKIVDNDIVLPLEYLEANHKPNQFLDFVEKIKGLLQTESKTEISRKLISPKDKVKDNKPSEKSIEAPVKNTTEPVKQREAEQPKGKHSIQCCSDHLDAAEHCKENHFNKMCFHEKECSHARINETRDRLRKKLNQLTNSKKTTKVINKTISKTPLEAFKQLNKSPSGLSCLSKEMAKMQNRLNVNRELINKTIAQHPKGKDIEPLKSPERLELPISESEEEIDNKQNENNNVDAWIKNTLSFIEGSEDKKFKNLTNNKKAAKKAKQKQKKEESKRIEELQELRAQFHDLYFKEFISKNEVKTLKMAKKKDKKRITDLESNIKKLGRAKSKIETSILEMIGVIKFSNAEFKFSYLPTKEQQQEFLKKPPQPDTTKIIPPNIQKPNDIKTSQNDNVSPQPCSTSNPLLVKQQNVQIGYRNQQSEEQQSLDPSKRIVTIRRVNLPHVTEPQVTVTAKGASPDKDKLLYTFINGQLVPAASLDSQTLSVLQPNIFPHLKQMQLSYKQNQASAQQQSQIISDKNGALSDHNVAKTKTQLKKEKKRAKTLATEMEMDSSEQIKNIRQNSPILNVINTIKKDVKNTKEKSENSNEKLKTRESTKVIQSKLDLIENKSKKIGETRLGKNKKEEKLVKENSSKTNSSREVNDTNRSEKFKQKIKVVDNGQFDNNQFKMLHLDELSLESDDSEHDWNKNSYQRIENDQKKIKSSNLPLPKMKENNSKINKEKPFTQQPKQVKTDEKKSAVTKSTEISTENTTKPTSYKQKKLNKKPISKETPKNKQHPDRGNTVLSAENMAKSLHHSLQKLNLNADTTIELAKNTLEAPSSMMHLNISIMDQLNRGVQVEDLALPPGITLTKVDPGRAEALRAKRESIGKLSQPMQTQPQPQNNINPPSIISPALLPHLGRYGQEQNGVIMVEAMGLKPTTIETSSNNDVKKTAKKNKRKNKKKKSELNTNDNLKIITNKNNEPKMITLRNPMFHASSSVQNQPLPAAPARATIAPLPLDQPAAIIKNENGMFTIRNPALHQAFSNGYQNNYRQYNSNYYPPNDNCDNFSYFSDNMVNNNGSSFNGNNVHSSNGGKCISAIGSEVKNAQQQKKKENQWQRNQENCSPQTNANNYLETINCSPMQQKYQQSNYYNGQPSCFDVFPPTSPNRGNLFDDNAHNCDDSPPPSVVGFNRYLDGIPNNGNKYDDMSFLRNLMPGQRLNSEVTIHNINESKFTRNATSPIVHGVEITPISSSSRTNNFQNSINLSQAQQQQHQSHQHQHQHQPGQHHRNYNDGLGEYGDNLFAPNQMLNLSELESDERDIESFKRFSYGFEPPKNKPKVNINVNDILASSKKISTARTSPYLDESLESFVRNMNSLKIATENNSVNACSSESCNGSNWW